MSHPAPPPYATYAPPPVGYPAPPAPGGAGLAIASMVLGIIALLLSWIPIVNNLAAVLAVVGLGLGIPALLRARRGTHGGKGMAITGLVTSIVSLVLVVATQILFAAAIDEVFAEAESAASAGAAAPESAESAESAPAEAPPADTGTAPVPLGTPVPVGDYQVSVDRVELDGNATAAAGNEFNEPPTGQYVVVTLTATYQGTAEGTPGMDLTAVYNGTDSRQYNDYECLAMLPQDAMDAPTLNPGGTATFQFCMDVPPAAIPGGSLHLEPTVNLEGERTFFAVQ